MTCYAEWGGWHWQAEGGDRQTAARRLVDRLGRMNPFDGFDSDWGEPGYQTGELADEIPAGMRELMKEWAAYGERRGADLQGLADRLVVESRDHETR